MEANADEIRFWLKLIQPNNLDYGKSIIQLRFKQQVQLNILLCFSVNPSTKLST